MIPNSTNTAAYIAAMQMPSAASTVIQGSATFPLMGVVNEDIHRTSTNEPRLTTMCAPDQLRDRVRDAGFENYLKSERFAAGRSGDRLKNAQETLHSAYRAQAGRGDVHDKIKDFFMLSGLLHEMAPELADKKSITQLENKYAALLNKDDALALKYYTGTRKSEKGINEAKNIERQFLQCLDGVLGGVNPLSSKQIFVNRISNSIVFPYIAAHVNADPARNSTSLPQFSTLQDMRAQSGFLREGSVSVMNDQVKDLLHSASKSESAKGGNALKYLALAVGQALAEPAFLNPVGGGAPAATPPAATPPAATPPAATPPAATPPAATPPAATPPAATPPAATPPAATPPAATPPAATPPAATPPAATPPAATPPAATPPAATPPAATPPAATPPAATPPAATPPAATPPAATPPAATPPAATPPAATPPAATPPAATPPAATPPAAIPPAATPPAATPPAATPPAATPSAATPSAATPPASIEKPRRVPFAHTLRSVKNRLFHHHHKPVNHYHGPTYQGDYYNNSNVKSTILGNNVNGVGNATSFGPGEVREIEILTQESSSAANGSQSSASTQVRVGAQAPTHTSVSSSMQSAVSFSQTSWSGGPIFLPYDRLASVDELARLATYLHSNTLERSVTVMLGSAGDSSNQHKIKTESDVDWFDGKKFYSFEMRGIVVLHVIRQDDGSRKITHSLEAFNAQSSNSRAIPPQSNNVAARSRTESNASTVSTSSTLSVNGSRQQRVASNASADVLIAAGLGGSSVGVNSAEARSRTESNASTVSISSALSVNGSTQQRPVSSVSADALRRSIIEGAKHADARIPRVGQALHASTLNVSTRSTSNQSLNAAVAKAVAPQPFVLSTSQVSGGITYGQNEETWEKYGNAGYDKDKKILTYGQYVRSDLKTEADQERIDAFNEQQKKGSLGIMPASHFGPSTVGSVHLQNAFYKRSSTVADQQTLRKEEQVKLNNNDIFGKLSESNSSTDSDNESTDSDALGRSIIEAAKRPNASKTASVGNKLDPAFLASLSDTLLSRRNENTKT